MTKGRDSMKALKVDKLKGFYVLGGEEHSMTEIDGGAIYELTKMALEPDFEADDPVANSDSASMIIYEKVYHSLMDIHNERDSILREAEEKVDDAIKVK